MVRDARLMACNVPIPLDGLVWVRSLFRASGREVRGFASMLADNKRKTSDLKSLDDERITPRIDRKQLSCISSFLDAAEAIAVCESRG